MTSTSSDPAQHPLASEAAAFYRRTMTVLEQGGIRFLVGGAYAFAHYTGIVRDTKDLDLFVLESDADAALAALADAGYTVEHGHNHWLGKARSGDDFVDLIYGSGNGVTSVDEGWFQHARQSEVMGAPVSLCPPEEMIWSKSFIMERERYDGADVAHLLHSLAEDLDWQRLLERFGENWRLLLTHLVMFGYIYPSAKQRIPSQVLDRLLVMLSREMDGSESSETAVAGKAICRGTLLSRAQYLSDLERHGYLDARLPPIGTMTEDDIERWTAAIDEDGDAAVPHGLHPANPVAPAAPTAADRPGR
jgi:hypothetical protein